MANTENERERVQLARARLIRAVTAGDADWMRALVERMPPDLCQYFAKLEVEGNYSMPHSGEISGASLLILAVLGPDGDVLGVTAGTVSVVRELISRGADASRELTVINPTTSGAGIADYTVQRRDADGLLKCVAWAESSITPLHLAVTAQSTKYGADLVEAISSAPGVDVNKKTTPADATTSLGGSTPLFLYPCQTPLAGALRAPAVNGRFAIVSALLRAGASSPRRDAPPAPWSPDAGAGLRWWRGISRKILTWNRSTAGLPLRTEVSSAALFRATFSLFCSPRVPALSAVRAMSSTT